MQAEPRFEIESPSTSRLPICIPFLPSLMVLFTGLSVTACLRPALLPVNVYL